VRPDALHAACKSAQHPAQRVALSGMVERQCGQSLVVGASSAACLLLSRLTARTMRKMTKAMIRKVMMSLISWP
jgi:hypothetical protein